MTESTPDLDERLARLAARKAGPKPAAPADGTSTTATAATATATAPARARTRRKHPAAAARILSLGLSSSAFLSIIGVFGQQHPGQTSNVAAAPVARRITPVRVPVHTKVVVKYLHHTVYVDQYGRPVSAATAANGPARSPAQHSGTGSAPQYSAPATGFPASGSPAVAPAVPPPAPVTGPAPTNPAVAPAPTPAPAPAPRPTPPPPVVTTPPPPPPPACSGTKCP